MWFHESGQNSWALIVLSEMETQVPERLVEKLGV
jgi:hypothetical protein